MRKYFFFMGPVLQQISEGAFFRMVFAIALRILAILIAIAGLVGFIAGWQLAGDLPAVAILGLIIFQLLFAAAIYMVVHVLFIRARDVAELPPADFTVIPIFSIFLKLIGEICACLLSVIGVGSGIFTWFAGGRYPSYLLRDVLPLDILDALRGFRGSGAFVEGIVYIVAGALAAFFVLVFFYLLSESTVVVVDIAKDTRVTRQIVEQYDKTEESS